jgi:hypothetical protein
MWKGCERGEDRWLGGDGGVGQCGVLRVGWLCCEGCVYGES